MNTDHTRLWEECLRIIRDNIRPEQYDAWFKPVTSLKYEDGKLTLAVPSAFFVEHIENTYLSILVPALRRVYGESFKGLYYHHLQVNNKPDTVVNEAGLQLSPALKRQATGLFQAPAAATFDSQLNPRYTFENYCGGTSNKIAMAIGEAIARDPKCKTFNPLFVFGPTGVGKTHLIQAIGIKILENNPASRILYVSARLFESQFTVATRNGKINEFINFYQSIDTLIIDDIQDLVNKEKWIAFVGLRDGRPYEIFTGLADDEDGIFCPKSVNRGKIIKATAPDGTKRYDFQFVNKRGHKTTIEGLSDKFNPEYWNYAKLISGVLRYGMPIDQVLKLVAGLELDSQSINTWKMGVERALKKYVPNDTPASGQRCPNCGEETLVFREGCLICTSCGTSKCG